MATTHYLEALDLEKEIIKVHTIFCGNNPIPTGWWAVCHAQSTFNPPGLSARSIWSG